VLGRRAVSSERLTLAAFLLLVLLSGGNAVSIHVVGDELDAFWAASLRFGAAGCVFVALMAAFGVPLPTRRAIVGALLYGALGFGAALGLFFVAIPMTGAGAGQLLLGLVPLITLVLAPLHGLEPFRLRPIAGSVLALAGVAILAADRIALSIPASGIGIAILAAVCLAEAGVVLKLTSRTHPIASNAVGMLGGAALLFVVSRIVGERWALPAEGDTWAALTYMVLFGSVAVFALFVHVLQHWKATTVSFEYLLIPLATVPFSALLTGEVITPTMLLGGALILAGVYVGALAPELANAAAQPAPDI
jgi:drug/metabolite transporter (DMT)-like permease